MLINKIQDLYEIIKARGNSSFFFLNNKNKRKIKVEIKYISKYKVYVFFDGEKERNFTSKKTLIEAIINYMYKNNFKAKEEFKIENLDLKIEFEKRIEKKKEKEAKKRVEEIAKKIKEKTGMDLLNDEIFLWITHEDGGIAYSSYLSLTIFNGNNKVIFDFEKLEEWDSQDSFKNLSIKKHDKNHLKKEILRRLEKNEYRDTKKEYQDIKAIFYIYKAKELKKYETHYSRFKSIYKTIKPK